MKEYRSAQWDDKLSVGYATIDGHHKKLVSITQEVFALLEAPEPLYKAKIGKILKKLSDYTVYHFREEESVMAKYDYPCLEEHTKIHKSFVEKLTSALPLIAKGEKEVAIDMYNFLTKWLIEHIAIEDNKWAEYVHKNYPNDSF